MHLALQAYAWRSAAFFHDGYPERLMRRTFSHARQAVVQICHAKNSVKKPFDDLPDN